MTSRSPFLCSRRSPANALTASATFFFRSNRLMLSTIPMSFQSGTSPAPSSAFFGRVSMHGYTTFSSLLPARRGHVSATTPFVKLELTATASANPMLHSSSASKGSRYSRFHHRPRPRTRSRSGKWQ